MSKLLAQAKFQDCRGVMLFQDICEALLHHSDTALLTILPQMCRLTLTDSETFCAVTLSMSNSALIRTQTSVVHSHQICLESIIAELKYFAKHQTKLSILIYASTVCIQNDITKETRELTLRNRRNTRPYFHVSDTHFESKSQNRASFYMDELELNRIITSQAILAGQTKSLGTLDITAVDKSTMNIVFKVENQSGVVGSTSILTKTNSTQVCFVQTPKHPHISTKYFVTYLKRSQLLFTLAKNSRVLVQVSDLGILCRTDIAEECSVTMFTRNIANEDLDSYV